jgi:hypothetical protein
MSDTRGGATRSSWLAGAGAILSILACYGTIALIAILSLMGISLAVNEQAWAAAIVAFAILALLGVALGYRFHRNFGPLAVAALGALLIVLAMYGSGFLSSAAGLNPRAVELLGFAALLLAAIWDWRLKNSSKPIR